MEVLDADIYQLYQHLLFGDTQASKSREEEAAAAAAEEEQAPMMGGVGDNPAGYVEGGGSTLPPLQIPGGGGVCAGNGDGFIPGGGNKAGNGGLAAPAEDPMHGGGVPDLPASMQEQSDLSGAYLSEFVSDEVVINSLLPGTNQAAEPNQPASDSSGLAQVSAGPPEMMSQMSAMECPQRQADVPQAVPDNETAEVPDNDTSVGVERGDELSMAWSEEENEPSMAWSEEENQLLLQGLSRFADQDNFTKYCSIALGLPKKTVIDVSYRVRWLEKMKNAAKEAKVGPEDPASRNITKGKGTEGASKENNKYPLSIEALDPKSAKDITEENDMLLDQIEKMLKTGQVKDHADYFYHVKTGMDALQNKVSGLDSIMEGFTVDDKEWENVFKDRDSSLAAKDTTITPP